MGIGQDVIEDRPNGEVDRRPLRYRTQLPPWGDQTLVELAPRLHSRVVVAAIRSATAGIPQGHPFVHPFVVDELAGTHNGWIEGFRRHVARPLLAHLSDETFATLDGMSDANALFLLAVDAYRQGAGLLDAARHATETAAAITAAVDQNATLTLVLADHTGVAAVNEAVGHTAHSLYVHRGSDRTYLASEPLDHDLEWQPVAQGDGVLVPLDPC